MTDATRKPLRDHSRILFAAVVGTTVEYYDFYIYGVAAAMFFGPVFFPHQSPGTQILLALMTYGIAFFARPVGAVAFGHFGDRVGRKSTLVASLLLMGGCTLAIAFLPTYAMAGWVAPTLLCLLRFGQGFGLGGEWAGAALLSVENAPPGWRVRFGATSPMGSTLGKFAAVAVFLALGLALSREQMLGWGWRLPFLASAVLVAIGLWVRFNIRETAEFRAAVEVKQPPKVPIARLLREHPAALIAGSIAVICPFALVHTLSTYALAQATGPLGYDREAFLVIELVACLCSVAGILVASSFADRTTAAGTLVLGALAVVPLGAVFGPGLESGVLPLVAVTMCLAGFVWGCAAAAMAGWLTGLFPVEVRYTGVAFAFNLGGIFGGMVPIAMQVMANAGAAAYAGLLLSLSALLSFAAVKLASPSGPNRSSLLATPV